MTAEELKKGEYETVEYKEDIPKDKEKYLKTAVAFANASGGRLVFGIENNTWAVRGFSDGEVFQKYDAIANSIFDSCEPSIVPIMAIEEIDDKKVIIAEIRAGMAKPYFIRKHGMLDGTYIRMAGVTRKAEPYMIKELQLEGSNRGFDATQVVGEITIDEINALCDRIYNHALERCQSDEQRADQKKLTVSQLIMWKIVVQVNNKYYPTNAWKLLTGDIGELLPEAFIQLAAFKGKTRSVFLDKQEAKGPIDMQIEEAMAFVKKHINLGSRIGGTYRSDFYELPIDSVREMISNAVCHRSYLAPGSIQVAVYEDRLEVTSPGKLSADLTIEQIIAGNSRIQNPAIGAVFQYMHIIEKWGTGIPRVFEDARLYGLGEPKLENFGTSFRITLNRRVFDTDPLGVIDPATRGQDEHQSLASNDANDAKNQGLASNDAKNQGLASFDAKQWEQLVSVLPEKNRERAVRILMEISRDQHVSAGKLGEILGVSRATIQRATNEMKSEGILMRQGSSNGGKWIIQRGELRSSGGRGASERGER